MTQHIADRLLHALFKLEFDEGKKGVDSCALSCLINPRMPLQVWLVDTTQHPSHNTASQAPPPHPSTTTATAFEGGWGKEQHFLRPPCLINRRMPEQPWLVLWIPPMPYKLNQPPKTKKPFKPNTCQARLLVQHTHTQQQTLHQQQVSWGHHHVTVCASYPCPEGWKRTEST